jgi:hypothetical protein
VLVTRSPHPRDRWANGVFGPQWHKAHCTLTSLCPYIDQIQLHTAYHQAVCLTSESPRPTSVSSAIQWEHHLLLALEEGLVLDLDLSNDPQTAAIGHVNSAPWDDEEAEHKLSHGERQRSKRGADQEYYLGITSHFTHYDLRDDQRWTKMIRTRHKFG